MELDWGSHTLTSRTVEAVRTLEQGLRLPHILMITNECVLLISNADSKTIISKHDHRHMDTWTYSVTHGHMDSNQCMIKMNKGIKQRDGSRKQISIQVEDQSMKFVIISS